MENEILMPPYISKLGNKIRKTGDSYMITIPKIFVEAFNLEGKAYSIKPKKDGKILILTMNIPTSFVSRATMESETMLLKTRQGGAYTGQPVASLASHFEVNTQRTICPFNEDDKMNKFAILSVLLMAGMVAAVTTVDTTWNGGGSLGMNFVSGNDASSLFSTSGALISGEFHATDYDNNPYGYSVDTTNANVRAHVVGGTIEYQFTRTDSYTPMYGPAGQVSYTGIGSTGTGDLAWTSTSNYAALTNSEYGFQNNNQMQATGDYTIIHSLSTNANNGAQVTATGSGTAQITDMCDSTWGTSYTFGKGCGCYTNANVNTVGSGTFDLFADADNQITTDTGIIVNGGTLDVHSVFSGGFHFNDFALSGN